MRRWQFRLLRLAAKAAGAAAGTKLACLLAEWLRGWLF